MSTPRSRLSFSHGSVYDTQLSQTNLAHWDRVMDLIQALWVEEAYLSTKDK